MSKITVRHAVLSDIKKYEDLQASRWREENIASHDNLMTRFRVFPEGMLVAEEGGEIVGMVYAIRIAGYDENHPASWYEITNNGACDNHVTDGPILFGVDLTTAPGVGARAGDALLVGIGKMAIQKNIKWCMLGGRMPGYHAHKDSMSAEEYLWKKDSRGRFLDRQVRFYASVPGIQVVRVLPHYFDDPESDDNGVLLRWQNPFYNWPMRRVLGNIFPSVLKIEEFYGALEGIVRRLGR